MDKCIQEYRKLHPEVFSTWIHLYGNKWLNTYDLEIRIVRHPGELKKLLP